MDVVHLLNSLSHKFSGGVDDDIERFFVRLEVGMQDQGAEWSDAAKVRHLYSATSGVAQDLVSRSIGPDVSNPKMTYKELKKQLLDAFKTTTDPRDAYAKLNARFLKPSEPLRTYAQEMVSLCLKADPNMQVTRQIEYIVQGLPIELQRDLKLMTETTVPDALLFIEKMQAKNARLAQAEQLRLIQEGGTAPASVHHLPSTTTSAVQALETVVERLAGIMERFHQLQQQ